MLLCLFFYCLFFASIVRGVSENCRTVDCCFTPLILDWHIKLHELSNTKAIPAEEQWWYYLIHSWEYRGNHPFPKFTSSKVNIIAQLEFKLTSTPQYSAIAPRGLTPLILGVESWLLDDFQFFYMNDKARTRETIDKFRSWISAINVVKKMHYQHEIIKDGLICR